MGPKSASNAAHNAASHSGNGESKATVILQGGSENGPEGAEMSMMRDSQAETKVAFPACRVEKKPPRNVHLTYIYRLRKANHKRLS